MIEGYTPASTIEFNKNPNWYLTWTVEGREYTLPFIDKIIPQEATRLAAMRTGKIDILKSVRTTDMSTLEKSNPDLGKATPIQSARINWMPMNKPPFDDIRVRTAMNMAIDRQVYTDALFGG